METAYLYVGFYDRNVLYENYNRGHRIHHAYGHPYADLALIYFVPHRDDPPNIIHMWTHTHIDFEYYYTIGHGLTEKGINNPPDYLRGTSIISMPSREYANYKHRPALSHHELAVFNNISSICDGDSGNYV